MGIRDMYTTMLEKRAEEVDSAPDSQAIANAEHASNVQDQRTQVGDLFAKAPAAEKDTTSCLSKALPKAKKTEGTQASNPMLKTATLNEVFFSGLRETGLLKTASPEYLRVTYAGFNDELEKIAKMMPAEILKNLAKVPKRKPSIGLKPTGQKGTWQVARGVG